MGVGHVMVVSPGAVDPPVLRRSAEQPSVPSQRVRDLQVGAIPRRKLVDPIHHCIVERVPRQESIEPMPARVGIRAGREPHRHDVAEGWPVVPDVLLGSIVMRDVVQEGHGAAGGDSSIWPAISKPSVPTFTGRGSSTSPWKFGSGWSENPSTHQSPARS